MSDKRRGDPPGFERPITARFRVALAPSTAPRIEGTSHRCRAAGAFAPGRIRDCTSCKKRMR